jgi:hypothetical protein
MSSADETGFARPLQRQDIDVGAGTVTIRQAYTEQRGVGLVLGPPEPRAGHRLVSLPAAIFPAVREYLTARLGRPGTR